jgi:hypothetical protein
MVEFEMFEVKNTNPVCGTCRHCTAVIYGKTQADYEIASMAREPKCRRYPPFFGGYPNVDPLMHFCGEYHARSQEEITAVAGEIRNQMNDSKIPGMEVQ